MRKMMIYCAVLLLLASGSVGATATYDQYCTSLFSNSPAIVSNVFSGTGGGGGPIATILGFAMLIVVLVFVLLAVVYGIGIGFGISKLVTFARTEYLESFFNILIIIVIAGGVVGLSAGAGFFSNVAGVGLAAPLPSSSGGLTYNLYNGICTDMINTQLLPSLERFLWLTLQQPFYNLIAGLTIKISVASNFYPSISFMPWNGVAIYEELVIFEISPLLMIIFLGVTMIFMLYVIFFLFPVFLFVGILLRSFPWTRAAGGALLALFISFYIVFPALLYPFSALQLGQSGSSTYCQNGAASLSPQEQALLSAGDSGFVFPPCTIGSSLPILTSFIDHVGNYIEAILGIVTGEGSPFIANLDIYVGIIALAVGKLLGLGIAFIVSFDLLEALGDLLGSPSLQSRRLLERLI